MSAIALHDTAEKYFYHAIDLQEQPVAQIDAALLLPGQTFGADKMVSRPTASNGIDKNSPQGYPASWRL